MKLSPLVIAAAQTWRTANPNLYEFLRGLAVEFHGTAAGHHGSFTASGVVVRATATDAYIVTARHNLTLAAAGEPVDPVTHYTTRIRARLYDVHDALAVDSPIVEVYQPDGPPHHGLDVAVMRVSDRAFVQRARGLVAPGTTGHAFKPDTFDTEGWLIPLADDYTARAVLANGRTFPGVPAVAMYQNHTLVQMGYGVHTANLYAFRYRVLAAQQLVAPTLIDTTHEGWTSVFTFDTTDTNSGAPGDSGGPVFAVPPANSQNELALVAVHSGANYFAGRTDNDPASPTVNNAFTWVADAPMP
ncbi:hypothetical protein AB0M43_06670 [Longispora sp. NPDC051575]|uniref:hypothetical protein n=1 Tax=Longispora sp. NPDC051575 TaxID=3154943 RepID=UPI00343B2FD4